MGCSFRLIYFLIFLFFLFDYPVLVKTAENVVLSPESLTYCLGLWTDHLDLVASLLDVIVVSLRTGDCGSTQARAWCALGKEVPHSLLL